MSGIRTISIVGIAAMAAGLVLAQGWSETDLVGKAAPDFSLAGTDGKTHTLKSLTEKAPVFVVFWKERCPHNPRASALFNQLAKAYEGKAHLIGVVTASVEGAQAWRQKFAVPYTFLSDGDKATIAAYNMKYSIVTVQVGTNGKITRVFPGYGSAALAGLNMEMAAAAKTQPAAVDLGQAPERLTYG